MEPDQHDTEAESDRRALNIFLVIFFVAITGIGVWLANAMVDARKTDDCMAQGRRNCAPIEVPMRQP